MRKQDWPKILCEQIEEWKEKPFVWGVSDCLQFPVAVAVAMLDYDPHEKAGEKNFKYDTQEEADFLLKQYFNGSMAGVFDLAFQRVHKNFAQRGDIVIVNYKDVDYCGVVDSSGRYAACKAVSGVLFVPMKHSVAAWRVE